MPNPVAFFEIAGPDGPALQRFYHQVFGWEMDTERVPGYAYLKSGGAVEGGIRQDPPDKVLYLKVLDLQAALDQVTAAGGSVVLPPMVIPGVVSFALFKDPAGNIMGLIL